MMANSIIAGNDFRLIIRAKKSTGAYLADMDLADVEDLRIYLTRAGRSKVLQSYTLDVEGHAVIYVSAGVVTNATYGIEMVGVYGGARLRAHNTSVFTISGHGGGNSGVLNDYYADIVFVINVAATDVYVQNAIEAHNEDEASHPHLLQLIEEAGDVDDVQIDGESIVDENKIAHIDSSQFGKVDDVKINGTSVVSNKEANIAIPEKVSDLPNDADYATKSELTTGLDAKQDTITAVADPTIADDGGNPSASVDFEGGEMAFAFRNLKLRFSDLTPEERATLKGDKGDKGDQGDSAVYDPSSPDAPDFEMANTTGQSTTKAMTQKAVTEAIARAIYDISAANSGATYADLSAALGNNGSNIPANLRKGGMSVRFVQSSDNKYVQYRLMHTLDNASTAAADFANTANWQDEDALTIEQTYVDLAITDENKKAIVGFKDGHILTKNFDSSKNATGLNRGLMSANDKAKLDTIEQGAEINDVEISSNINYDFAVSDENNNRIIIFKDGHILTKNFNSKDALALEEIESSAADMSVSDESNNPIFYLYKGDIFSKNFSSKSTNEIINSIKIYLGNQTTTNSSFDDRLHHLEAAPPTDIDLLTSNIMTQCREEFAPIGHADVSYTPKRKIKIFFIGNSVTQDHVGYLPWLFRQLYQDDVDFTIANFYYAGRSIKNYVEDFITGNTPGLYSYATNTEVWTQNNGVYLPDAITRENWDVISIQAYGSDEIADADYAPTFVEWLRNNSPSSFELAYLMHQNFSTAENQKHVRDTALKIIKENPCSILFAPYFCMNEAQKYWQVSGVLSPTGDGTHLREGLPVMITGMHLMEVICKRFGLLSKVINNGLMMTDAIWQTLNVPGANGRVDETMNTIANYTKAQYCTVQGTKMSEEWFNKAVREMISNFV